MFADFNSEYHAELVKSLLPFELGQTQRVAGVEGQHSWPVNCLSYPTYACHFAL
jgi:hypothetical protein